MKRNIRQHSAASGFTLIEVLVALVIGIISMTLVLQTFSASEANKRTSTGGDDAQVAGALSLFNLERDMNQAGYGISATPIIGCSVTMPAAGGSKVVPLAPVTINPSTSLIPAGDTNTDTLLIVYGNTNGPTEGDVINSSSGKTYTMQAATGWVVKDYVTAVQYVPSTAANPTPNPTPTSSSPCGNTGLDTIAALPSGTSTALTVTTGGVPASSTPAYTLYDLGQAPAVVGYRVVNAALTSCNYVTTNCSVAANWSEVSSNIVSMHAVYGHDTSPAGSMTGVASTWDQMTPNTTCGWLRVPAVAIALVARNTTTVNASAQNSNNGAVATTSNVTTAAPVWQEPIWGTGTLTWAGATAPNVPFDLSANNGIPSTMVSSGITWQNYRYRLYSTVVPLHNITWSIGSSSTTSC